MKNLKKLMIFTLVALNAAPAHSMARFMPKFTGMLAASSALALRAAPVSDAQQESKVVDNSNDRTHVWAYCKKSENFADVNSCNQTLDSLKPGFFTKKKTPAQAVSALELLVRQGNSSLVTGVDVDHKGEHTEINKTDFRVYPGFSKDADVCQSLNDADRDQARVCIDSGVSEDFKNHYYSSDVEVLQGKKPIDMGGADFSNIFAAFNRMISLGYAKNPTISFRNEQKPTFVDYISGAATL